MQNAAAPGQPGAAFFVRMAGRTYLGVKVLRLPGKGTRYRKAKALRVAGRPIARTNSQTTRWLGEADTRRCVEARPPRMPSPILAQTIRHGT